MNGKSELRTENSPTAFFDFLSVSGQGFHDIDPRLQRLQELFMMHKRARHLRRPTFWLAANT